MSWSKRSWLDDPCSLSLPSYNSLAWHGHISDIWGMKVGILAPSSTVCAEVATKFLYWTLPEEMKTILLITHSLNFQG